MDGVRYEPRADGTLVAWVFGTADRVLLRRCAELLEQEIGAVACERFDGGDRVFCDFVLAGAPLTLLLDAAAGLAVTSSDGSGAGAALVRRVAEHLKRHLDR